jgi:hypothetical protein
MANGTTRLALSKLQLAGKSGQSEHSELMSIEDKKHKKDKIPLKYSSEHNHSTDTLKG